MSDQIHHPSEEADINPTTGNTATDNNGDGDFAVSVDHKSSDPGNTDTASDADADAGSESGQDTGTEG